MPTSAKILLIGRPQTAFMAPVPSPHHLTVCESILEGIERARKEPYDTIFVVLAGIEGRARQALETLRKINPQASLILLAAMVEEPLAIKLVSEAGTGRRIADDYCICPVRPEELLWPKASPAGGASLTAEKELDYQRRIRELEILATQDDLTGLKNRRYLNQFLIQILSLARQYHFRITLLLFDIDNFKHYNDQYGHGVGDNVLRQAGQLIRHCCRSHDVVARVGGDEFAVVFWDLPEKRRSARQTRIEQERRKAEGKHPRQPIFMSERFRKEINAARLPFLGPQGRGKLTISGGLASFPDDGKIADQLMARADEALLEAKRTGKNKIVIIGQKNHHSRAAEIKAWNEIDSQANATEET